MTKGGNTRNMEKKAKREHINMLTPGTYGLVSGGAHSSGTFMNFSMSSNMFTAHICALSNL